MKDIFRILAINPGSTSTKVAVYENENCIFAETIRHSKEDLAPYDNPDRDVMRQKTMRLETVKALLQHNNILIASIDAVVGRAGRLPAMPGGTYLITDDILADIPHPLVHPALLGTLIAREIGDEAGIPAYFVDPTVVDELMDVARVTGIPEIQRSVIFHALNHKAVARRYCRENGMQYQNSRLIIAHMGGGISVAAHLNGRAVDVTNASNGEGPMAPERAGCIPGVPLADYCMETGKTPGEIRKLFTKSGGLNAYLGHSDMRLCEEDYISGRQPGKLCFEAMAYQVSKYIFSMAAALDGRVDAVILTGGLAYSERFVGLILSHLGEFAKVAVYPGEDEMLALAQGALRVLRGEEEAAVYTSRGAIKE